MRCFPLSLILISAAVTGSCASVSEISDLGLRAPSATERHHRASDEATVVLNRYREGRQFEAAEKFAEACAAFLSVSNNTSIPKAIQTLAAIRSAANCEVPQVTLPESVPSWLAEEAARAKLAMAKRSNDLLSMSQAIAELSVYEKTQALKVLRLNDALSLIHSLREKEPSRVAINETIRQVRERIVQIAPRYALKFSDFEGSKPTRMEIAQDLRNAREFEKARKLYRQIASDPSQSAADQLKALDGFRMTFKLQLRTTEFLQATQAWLDFADRKFLRPGIRNKDANLVRIYYETALAYARAIWTDHRPSDALRFLENLEAKIGKAFPSFSLHDSALVRARIAEERGQFEKMHQILADIQIDKLPDRATKARILWFRGWNLRRLPGRQEMALGILEQANVYEDSYGASVRNLYWIARLNGETGKPELAKQRLQEIADLNQFGYYGILAYAALGRSFDSLQSAAAYDPRARSPLPDSMRVGIDWLVALGEVEIGRKFFNSISPNEIWNSAFSMERKEATLNLMARLELYTQATLRMEELPPAMRTDILRRNPGLLFPTPHEEKIREEASRHGVDPALIYAIIRQESLFNTFARSHADAFGLMQLIPEVAALAARKIGMNLTSPEQLYAPEVNIPLGTVFLHELFKKYDGRFILAVAAYNANDKAIAGWLRTRMRADPIEFIEEIPYEETRTYVKLVLRNFVTYQRRLGTGSTSFPDWTLRLQTVSN